jgi:hypothetical protein
MKGRLEGNRTRENKREREREKKQKLRRVIWLRGIRQLHGKGDETMQGNDI